MRKRQKNEKKTKRKKKKEKEKPIFCAVNDLLSREIFTKNRKGAFASFETTTCLNER